MPPESPESFTDYHGLWIGGNRVTDSRANKPIGRAEGDIKQARGQLSGWHYSVCHQLHTGTTDYGVRDWLVATGSELHIGILAIGSHYNWQTILAFVTMQHLRPPGYTELNSCAVNAHSEDIVVKLWRFNFIQVELGCMSEKVLPHYPGIARAK